VISAGRKLPAAHDVRHSLGVAFQPLIVAFRQASAQSIPGRSAVGAIASVRAGRRCRPAICPRRTKKTEPAIALFVYGTVLWAGFSACFGRTDPVHHHSGVQRVLAQPTQPFPADLLDRVINVIELVYLAKYPPMIRLARTARIVSEQSAEILETIGRRWEGKRVTGPFCSELVTMLLGEIDPSIYGRQKKAAAVAPSDIYNDNKHFKLISRAQPSPHL
jgi:hypothetical protein